jgi:glycine/D-amino acid oxidase-like deaminating enzyme
VEADLCIYGGTSAGVIAAVQASTMGKKVILVEAGQHLGGMSVEGLGGTDIDNQPFRNSPAVGGLALEFYRRISAHYGRTTKFEAMLVGWQGHVALALRAACGGSGLGGVGEGNGYHGAAQASLEGNSRRDEGR